MARGRGRDSECGYASGGELRRVPGGEASRAGAEVTGGFDQTGCEG